MKLRAPWKIFTFVVLVSSAGAVSGCAVRAETEPVQYAEADPVIDVGTYPHEYYEGRDVYWVHDRWYYRDGGRWAYYRSEPPELRGRRAHWAPPPEHREERHDERREGPPPEDHHEDHGDDHGHDDHGRR